MGSWIPDELKYAGREHLDLAHAAHYDIKEDDDAVGELRLLRSLGIGGGSTVVDFGAGTGQFAMAAAAVVRKVIAVDVSEIMLSRLREKFNDPGSRTLMAFWPDS